MADSRQNYGATAAPLVVNDLVIAGVSGGDEGIRGFLDAYKAVDRRARLALLDGSRARRARIGDMDRPRHRARLRRRPGSPAPTIRKPDCSTGRPAIRVPTTTATSARATISTPHRVVALDPEHRQAEMALPVHAARPARLGRDRNADAGRCEVSRPAAQAAAARRIATDFSTCSTGSPARCWWPSRSSRS